MEVGPGNFPHPRANVLAEKFIDSNYHRSGDMKMLAHQELVQADGENLPFEDHSFDYVICSHVLEHVDNPLKFVAEQSRVAKKGYLETPSLLGEYLIPKESHRWVLLDIDDKIVMYEKEKIDFKVYPDFGYLFQQFLPKHSSGFKIMQRTHPGLFNVCYEWKENIDVLVNPDSSYYKEFFTSPINEKLCQVVFPSRSMKDEIKTAMWAISDIFGSVVKNKSWKK